MKTNNDDDDQDEINWRSIQPIASNNNNNDDDDYDGNTLPSQREIK